MEYAVIYDKNKDGGLDITLLDFEKVQQQDDSYAIEEFKEYIVASKFENVVWRLRDIRNFPDALTIKEKESIRSFANQLMEKRVIPVKAKWGPKEK